MPPKIQNWLNYRVRISLHDGRQLVGQFLAYDKHMNLVIADCEEYRIIKDKSNPGVEREVKRMLGLLLLRGESVSSLTPEAPPQTQQGKPGPASAGGPGRAVPVGRGSGGFGPQAGLTAPVRGVGGPAPMGMPPGMIPPSGAFR